MTKGADRKRIRQKRAQERERRAAERRRRKRLRTVMYYGIVVVALAGISFGLKVALAPAPPSPPSPPPTVTACTGASPKPFERDGGPFAAPVPDEIDLDLIYVATIKTYCGNLEFKIDPRDAPDAARSFIFLARKKFYDGLRFDHLLKDLGTLGGAANPGYTIQVPDSAAKRARGDLVMVDLDEAPGRQIGSRFAVLTGPKLDTPGIRIGSVLEGSRRTFDVLARLFQEPVSDTVPTRPLYILHIEIEEFTRG